MGRRLPQADARAYDLHPPMKQPVLPDDSFHSVQDDVGARAPVPPEFRSPSPAHLRDCLRRYRGTLPADVTQALLDAAAEIEGSEQAFAELVEQKRALQQVLAATQANLRAAVGVAVLARER